MNPFRRDDEVRRAHAEAERAREDADVERRDRTLQVTSLQVDLRRTQDELREAKILLARQRDLARRLDQMRRAEREWSRELRNQLQRMHERQGLLAHRQDVPALVLKTAMGLVEAEKGLLLAHEDLDHDGDLDLAAAEGFEHDATHSGVAQRFARQVLDEDEIVREDEPVADGPRTPADDEIDCLVAIPVYLRDRFSGVVICANRTGGFEALDDELLLALGDHAGGALQGGRLRSELADAHRSALRMLAELLAAGDPVRHGETAELLAVAEPLAEELGLEGRERETLMSALLVRDLGLLTLPDGTLDHPGPLTAEQRAAVELHPRVAFNVLHQVPALRDVAGAVLYHHERYDGRGYPSGLEGEAIPRVARVVAVLETFGALVNDRPYRPARSALEAAGELVAVAGGQLDPEITQLLVEQLHRTPTGVAPEPAVATGPSLFGELASPTTDALTLLGNHRAFAERIAHVAHDGNGNGNGGAPAPFAVAIVQLDELSRTNEETGYAAGDRMIQLAARHVQRVAGRLGAEAYRESGRRLALVGHRAAGDLAAQLATEFAAGPAVRIGVTEGHPGERREAVVGRARAALGEPVGTA